jgi:hypothetical protein
VRCLVSGRVLGSPGEVVSIEMSGYRESLLHSLRSLTYPVVSPIRLEAVPDLRNRRQRRQDALRPKLIRAGIHTPRLAVARQHAAVRRDERTIVYDLRPEYPPSLDIGLRLPGL